MKKLDFIKLEKETEKAINVTIIYNDEDITIWLPKSSATINGNFVEVKNKFWSHKELEIESEIRSRGHIVLSGSIKEFDKSFGISVRIYECVSEQTISRLMFFPKSQITDVQHSADGKNGYFSGSITVPAWLFAKKEEEMIEDNSDGSFHANTFEVEIEKEYIN